MASWQPRQAAESKAEAAALYCKQLDSNASVRRGLHRLLSIAGAHGRKSVTVAGIQLGEPAPPLGAAQRRQDQKKQEQPKRKPRQKTEARKEKDREKLEKKWQERRKEQQQQSLPPLPTQPVVVNRNAPVGAVRPPGLPSPPLQVASSTPTSTAATAADAQPESMDESGVATHVSQVARVWRRCRPLPRKRSRQSARSTSSTRAGALQREA